MSGNTKLFGERIKKRRKELRLSQLETAERLGISPNHLSSLETGKSKPSYDVICNLCDVLNINSDYFFSGSVRSNNVPGNVVDKMYSLSETGLDLVSNFIDWVDKKNL